MPESGLWAYDIVEGLLRALVSTETGVENGGPFRCGTYMRQPMIWIQCALVAGADSRACSRIVCIAKRWRLPDGQRH